MAYKGLNIESFFGKCDQFYCQWSQIMFCFVLVECRAAFDADSFHADEEVSFKVYLRFAASSLHGSRAPGNRFIRGLMSVTDSKDLNK